MTDVAPDDLPLTIPRRCNGPPDTANGGYACGLVAERLGGVSAQVSLRAPPPLERPLRVETRTGPNGREVRVYDGEALVAEAWPADPGVAPLEPPSFGEAQRASERGRERWADGHLYPTCVVCGPKREPGDGLQVFPGPLAGGASFAATWTADESVAGANGLVADPWRWAALDCPSSAPVLYGEPAAPILLARLTARLKGSVRAGERHLITSWPLVNDGRKHHTASALYREDGELRGLARALWVELRKGRE